MIHWRSLPLNEQLFTHFDPETGEVKTWAASRLMFHCRHHGRKLLVTARMDHDFAQLCKRDRGVEAHRLSRLTSSQLAEPLLLADLGRSQLLIDGTHRYVRKSDLGHNEFTAYLVPESLWKDFLVSDLPSTTPQELLQSHSGIQ